MILIQTKNTGSATSKDINNIAPERQVACLLVVMGPSTYGVLRNLVYPEKPKDKSLAEISTVLEQRFTREKGWNSRKIQVLHRPASVRNYSAIRVSS